MPVTREVLNEIKKDYTELKDLLGEKGLLDQQTKALIEKALGAELTEELFRLKGKHCNVFPNVLSISNR